MKASVIGLILMVIAWIIAQWGKYNNDLMTILCTVPIAIVAIVVYFYRGKPGQDEINFRIPKGNRLPDEEHLPQWVVNTRREMERTHKQNSK